MKYLILALSILSAPAMALDRAYAYGAGSYQINQQNQYQQQRETNQLLQQQLQAQQQQNTQQYQPQNNAPSYYIAPVQPVYFGR